MGAGHSHGATRPASGSAGARHRRNLVIALALTTAYLVAEVVGALVSGSLALLADAAHMLTDVGGMALALLAIWFAARPSNPSKTYGYLRTEVLAALANAVSALLIIFSGWTLADPLIGAAIGLFIVPRTWALLRHAVNILLEGTPAGFDLGALEGVLRALPEVSDVHDLHVWTITSGIDAMSGHLTIRDGADQQALLVAAREVLHEQFGISHSTIQIETAASRAGEAEMPV